ncbi:MAG: hypothetical protein KGL54_14525 [Sphingomonadales bacterium]|nr:hypothetical protein [Sphingomonadales bacterium]
MTNPDVWEVDRIAAAELLAALKDAADEDLPRIAEAFARHRAQSHQWAAKRVHRAAIEALENAASREMDRRNETWADGYRFAEQCLWACNPAELLGTPGRPGATKGQILRSLIRTAKKQRAA